MISQSLKYVFLLLLTQIEMALFASSMLYTFTGAKSPCYATFRTLINFFFSQPNWLHYFSLNPERKLLGIVLDNFHLTGHNLPMREKRCERASIKCRQGKKPLSCGWHRLIARHESFRLINRHFYVELEISEK